MKTLARTLAVILAVPVPASAQSSFDVGAVLRAARAASSEMPAVAAAPAETSPAPAQAVPGANDALKHLLSLKQENLDNLYAVEQAGPIPDGEGRGRAAFFPGTLIGSVSQIAKALLWQGKIFDAEHGLLVNKILGFKAIKAKVYYGESLLDGKPAIVLDYSETSRLAGMVRDEMRQVAPEIYLGRAYLRTPFGALHVLNFALDFRK